ncbi:uncharacterized protein SPPG_06946 [Spizellomyces punctatus DAOM BR117]|uniref:rRNA-processing protein EFG1 n=1 Tax=Spizellomyces punctatus (strain DAOM BR117) TaxID=645134 RepID=A0A0L0HB62_SPIPD|nr:uncharacterized protein SPPG_06946 [Spizellomyces punctatus DAOM BR117]KNC97958.1 hypothetical protein SPPG_06946 [Spizellomyces punctatus DAOM BR117]|eukprot:XP_016605998.1 hypothetical protein SPPG_06946 [Spizellomyces punctatus DAOM BR117]
MPPKPTSNPPPTSTTTKPKPKPKKHPNPLARKYGHHLTPKTSESLSTLRKQVRDAQRLLKRDSLPATQQQELQRKVKALKIQIEDRMRSSREEKLWAKYKYIRFVEQKKCTRKLKALRTQLSTQDTKDPTALHEAETNLAYTIHYPADLKYISLFPKEGMQDPVTDARRKRIWEVVSGRVRNGGFGKGEVLRGRDVFGESSKEEEEDAVEESEKEEEGDDFFLE